MASNGQVEPTETSPLLAKDVATPASASAPTDISSHGVIKDSTTAPINGAPTDEEAAGDADEPHNPIFEGMPEVAARLHILTPAVAIGVRSKSRFPKVTSS
jgi:hypothetical protein